MMPNAPRAEEKTGRYRLAAAVLILGAAALRILYFVRDCPLDLAPDEAHYWDWSRHLDWSYYSKGPLVAVLIRLSCWFLGGWSEEMTGSQMLAVRLPAVICGSLLLASLYVLAVGAFKSEKLAFGVVAIGLTIPVVAAGSSLMTIDAPFTCCWGWALVFGIHAVRREARWAWAAAGVCVALGILAKYTMILWVPSFALFLLCTPELRHKLWRPGFWVLAGVGALGAFPILLWNWQHDWITLRHAEGHAGIKPGAPLVHWTGPLVYVALQFAVLLGYWFIAWVGAMFAHHPGRESRAEVRYLWFMSVPTFFFFGLFSFKNGGGEPNWPLAAYLSGGVLTAGWLATLCHSPRNWLTQWTGTFVYSFAVLGLIMTVVVHQTHAVQPLLARLAGPATPERPLPLRQIDPTCRLRGWRVLAAEIDRLRDSLRDEGIEPLLAGAGWNLPGEIAFYCEGQPTVYSLGLALGDRHSQYDLWRPNPLADAQEYLGKTFILVGGHGDWVRDAFDHVEPTGEVTFYDRGQPIARWNVTICRGYRGLKPASQRSY